MRSLPALILIVISFVALFGLSASAWTGPTATAPGNNTSAPLNVGTLSQIKNGNIGVNGLAVFGNSILQGSSYLNWGATSGSSGYGIWDNGGTLNFKNSGGSWQSLQSIIAGLSGEQWTTNGSSIYYNGGNVGIGTASPGYPLVTSGSGGSEYGGTPEIWANGDNHTGGGIAISDDGGFFDYNDGWVTYNGSTGLKIGGANGAASTGGNLYVTGAVGIGTSNPTQRLDLGGGSIAMGYEMDNTHCDNSTSCWVSCSPGKQIIGGSAWPNGTWTYTNLQIYPGYGTASALAFSAAPTNLYVTIICADMR